MSEYIEYLKEVFSEFGAIRSRAMFGGHGLYHEDVMIGLVLDDTLYLKIDDDSVHHFEERELPQFIYVKGGRRVGMSYYQAPEEALEDPSEMREWASRAYRAALRSRKQ